MDRKLFKDALCLVAVFAVIIGALTILQSPSGALKVSELAMDDCEHRRELGELKSHADVAACANAAMVQEFHNEGSTYMPLIQRIADKRLEVARRLDKGEIDDAQAAEELSRFSDSAIAMYAASEHPATGHDWGKGLTSSH
jgi:hypothetical protein